MPLLLEALRTLLGASCASEANILTVADARAKRIIKEHGLVYSPGIEAEIDNLATSGPCCNAEKRAAYYLGLQLGWRAAQRFR
jgi:hypothetical protein